MAGITNLSIQRTLEGISAKVDFILDAMNKTNLTVNSVQTQLQGLLLRVDSLEHSREEGTKWANEVHEEMKKESTNEIKALTLAAGKVENNVNLLTEKVNTLIKILLWVLGIVGGIIAGVAIGVLVHVLIP